MRVLAPATSLPDFYVYMERMNVDRPSDKSHRIESNKSDSAARSDSTAQSAIFAPVLWLFVGKERKPPFLSPTLEHRASLGGRDKVACLSCHQQGTAPRRTEGHTGREDCWSCHEIAR